MFQKSLNNEGLFLTIEKEMFNFNIKKNGIKTKNTVNTYDLSSGKRVNTNLFT